MDKNAEEFLNNLSKNMQEITEKYMAEHDMKIINKKFYIKDGKNLLEIDKNNKAKLYIMPEDKRFTYYWEYWNIEDMINRLILCGIMEMVAE